MRVRLLAMVSTLFAAMLLATTSTAHAAEAAPLRVAAATAASAMQTYPVKTAVRGRTGAGTQHRAVKTFHPGSRVRIFCTTRNGKGQLWDKVSKTQNIYVLDKYIKTGTNKPVAAECGRRPAPRRPGVGGPTVPPPPFTLQNNYRTEYHGWYWEVLFNKQATAQAARDTGNFCKLVRLIPVIGKGESAFCKVYFSEFRREAQKAHASNQCVRWVFGLYVIPRPMIYGDRFCT